MVCRRAVLTGVLVCLQLTVQMAVGQETSPRVALMVGNASYRTAPLRNPRNDAMDMAAMLQKLGFEVMRLFDADQRTMETAIRTFGHRLRRGGGSDCFTMPGMGCRWTA